MFTTLVLVLSVCVFVFSAVQLYRILAEYREGEKEYEALQEIAIQTPSVEKAEEPEQFTVDFAALQAINPEVVAWLRFDEPQEISYPVVQGQDNDKYLHTTFEGKRNSVGALFQDAENTKGFTDQNDFIYGHNMNNGSMFGRLRKYKDKAFCEQHPYFYLYLPDGTVETYQVFSVSIVKDTARSYHKWYGSPEEFLSYVEHIRSVSLYPTDVQVGAEDKLLSLSTCTNVAEDERLLVHGVKLVPEVTETVGE